MAFFAYDMNIADAVARQWPLPTVSARGNKKCLLEFVERAYAKS